MTDLLRGPGSPVQMDQWEEWALWQPVHMRTRKRSRHAWVPIKATTKSSTLWLQILPVGQCYNEYESTSPGAQKVSPTYWVKHSIHYTRIIYGLALWGCMYTSCCFKKGCLQMYMYTCMYKFSLKCINRRGSPALYWCLQVSFLVETFATRISEQSPFWEPIKGSR